MQLVERLADELDVAGAPGRRPVRVAQVFEHEERELTVVVPAEQAREIVGLEAPVDPVLVPQEAGRRLVDRELRERASAVRELDEPPLHERVAAPGEPDERPGAEPRR